MLKRRQYIKIITLVNRIERKFYNGLYRLRYRPFLQIEGNCRLEKGLKIKPFLKFGDGLSIVLKGNNSIGSWTVFQGSQKIEFGLNSFCGEFCVFGCNAGIVIGENVMIAQAVTIRDTDHNFSRGDISFNMQGISVAPVTIGDNVWIGHGVIILKGVTIGSNTVIAAGAVVNRDIPSGVVAAGIPAKVIREI